MSLEKIERFIAQLGPLNSGSDFLDRVYHAVIRGGSLEPGTIEWAFTEDAQIIKALDRTRIQDSVLFANLSKARKLAWLLITEKGELNEKAVVDTIAFLERHLCLLGPERHFEIQRQRHFLKVLKTLKEGGEVVRLLRGISRPVANAYADELIRQTLLLPHNHPLTDAHARIAVLSAWLTYLRQNVGSCFATAPAIIIHDEQPVRLLTDLRDLLNTGRLKRTFGGVEYSFPMSPSWGIGDLRKQVVVDRFATQIADAPGFIDALSAANVIDPALPYEKKATIARYGLHDAIGKHMPGFGGGITTCENMLKVALLQGIGINEEDLQVYQERPRDLIQERLLNQFSLAAKKTNSKSSKGEKIAQFQSLFKAAKTAFKSMTDNALLKTWEFTIASFAESKSDFTRWNLYQSLGLQTSQPGGIGECMFRFIDAKLQVFRKQVQELQSQYEYLFLQLKALEAQMKNASSESQLVWLKADYNSRYTEYNHIQEKRDIIHEKANRWAAVYPYLSKTYLAKFPEYFQEIYDADMQEVAREFYDDSPAGFRLLCKHGRSNPSTWTMIYTPEQYTDSLIEFFTVTENEVSVADELEGMRDEFSQLITEVVRHLRTRDFLESSFKRIAEAYNVMAVEKPLENLEKISKKPWAYTSGGTMATLASCVYLREQAPTEMSKWVENETELLAFYLDALKTMPYNIARPYYENAEKSMLGYSPTHAFVIKPGMSPFLHGWQEESYTFSWIRDSFLTHWKQFLGSIRLTQPMIYRIVDELADRLHGEVSHLIKQALGKLKAGITPREFHEMSHELLKEERWMKRMGRVPFTMADFDGILYNLLPLFHPIELKQKIQNILDRLPNFNIPPLALDSLLDSICRVQLSKHPVLTAKDLREVTKAVIILATQSTTYPLDLHAEISSAMQKLGYSMPQPFIFADTNWVRDYFGFVVNPGTEEIELWRLDYSGGSGIPMPEWKKWLNGSERKPWGIYTRPYEYGQ